MNDAVLVTGGSGFVASHLVAQLLDEGYEVRASVRDLGNTAKCDPLRALATGRPGRLEVFEADLLDEGSFTAAMDGCTRVFHVASPFLMPEQIVDPRRDVLDPAVVGTRNVLDAVDATASVKRVVLTSTVGAIFGDYADVLEMRDRTLREAYVNTTSTLENNPYHYAKTQAESMAWQVANAQGRWSLVSINPGLVLGPSLSGPSDSGSLFLMNELMAGYFFYGAPDFSFTVADVREVATAHVRAAQRAGAHGRYIVARPEMLSFLEMGRLIRHRHRRRLLIPRHPVPDVAVRVLGPRFGLTQDYIAKHLGIRFAVDNQRSIDDLGITYRPAEETILDHFESWLDSRRKRTDRPGSTA